MNALGDLAAPRVGLRKDAQLRRDRLIAAAVKLYRSHGSDVALERISEEAGVTRPTLYRNFPDREAISAVVAEHHLNVLAERIAGWADADDAFFHATKLMAYRAIRSGGPATVKQFRRETGSLWQKFALQVENLLDPLLDRAKELGLVRLDFSIRQIHQVILMVAGGGIGDPDDTLDESAKLDKAMQLLCLGLTPRSEGANERGPSGFAPP